MHSSVCVHACGSDCVYVSEQYACKLTPECVKHEHICVCINAPVHISQKSQPPHKHLPMIPHLYFHFSTYGIGLWNKITRKSFWGKLLHLVRYTVCHCIVFIHYLHYADNQSHPTLLQHPGLPWDISGQQPAGEIRTVQRLEEEWQDCQKGLRDTVMGKRCSRNV